MKKQLLKERFQELAGIKLLGEEERDRYGDIEHVFSGEDEAGRAFGAADTDKRKGQVIGDILQLIKTTSIDPEDVLEAIGQEFKINMPKYTSLYNIQNKMRGL